MSFINIENDKNYVWIRNDGAMKFIPSGYRFSFDGMTILKGEVHLLSHGYFGPGEISLDTLEFNFNKQIKTEL